MIDVCDVMNCSQENALFCSILGIEKLDEIMENNPNMDFTEQEIDTGLSVIISGIGGVIRSLRYASDVAKFLTNIPTIRENIFDKDKQKYAAEKITRSYDHLHAFINKDIKGVAKKLNRVKIAPEKMPEYLDIMYNAAIECIDVYLEKFKSDIEFYQSKTRVTWADKVGVFNANQERTSGDVKGIGGNRKEWKKRIKQGRENLSPDTQTRK